MVDATRGSRPWRTDNSGGVEARCYSPRQGSRSRDVNAVSIRAAAFRSLGSHQPSVWLRLGSAALVANRINNKKRVQGTLQVPSLDPLLVCAVRGVKKLRLCGFEF